MITEDYVSPEVAKLLKEKGFDEYCFTAYSKEVGDFITFGPIKNSDITKEDVYVVTAPTHQMAMKWLREVHNISIEVVYDCSNDKTETISWWFANIKHINSSSSKENDCLTAYDSYEEAADDAIKYVLENWI